MPPKIKVQKQQIIDAAFQIAIDDGLSAVSARKVASTLKCSVAPIYVNFETFEQLLDEVRRKTIALHMQMCQQHYTKYPFLNMGIGSIMMAYEYKNLYRDIIAKCDICREETPEQMESIYNILKSDSKLASFNDDELREVFFRMSTFTIGLCAYASSEKMPYGITIDYLIKLQEETGEDVIGGMLSRQTNT